MATFVAIHGGFDGGWSWRGVAAELARRGHSMFPVTLTGSGDRAHLAAPEVTLQTHVSDVLNAVAYERLARPILVAHSSGGSVAAAALVAAPHVWTEVIYLDALVPAPGQCLLDVVGADMAAWMEGQAAGHGGWQLPPLGDDVDRRTGFLMGPAREVIAAAPPVAAAQTYVAFTDKPPDDPFGPILSRMADSMRGRAGVRYREARLPHFPLLDRPHAVADLLLDIVAADGPQSEVDS